MKKFAPIIAAALVAVMAVPALAWHVETEPGTAPVVGKHIDPRGDPWMRFIVKNTHKAFGKVCVPDEPWAQQTVFWVDGTGKSARAGECISLRAGKKYSGTWSNSSETESFYIDDVTPTYVVSVNFMNKKTGERDIRVASVPRGCTFRSGWLPVEGSTWFTMWDRTTKSRVFKSKMAPPGYYAPMWRGYEQGLSCPIALPVSAR